ncbi:hypothetical protein C1H46_010361 [Malus baccata]|uniref:Piwi domain-containing protein n=1 Tax=Malus baccata TaxID=106549 RepID=A0A540N0A2_MALBA|nr:hypothetical protein C1H46_010361 [Malus baccata]
MVEHNGYNKDELIQREFGMNIREDMALVNACVLQPPSLEYHDTGREKFENPRMGQWNMINKVGGRSTVLTDAIQRRIPLVSDNPTIIFGAGVNYPHPGEDSPSIAAEGYLPPVTYVVVWKTRHTRLFPTDHQKTDKSGNIQPGTVVDTQICLTEFDFYLNSHAGIQGTSRPAHYHVLYDENRFTPDALQMLTNNLCYTFARCTRSVSIVPPAYYAHLAAVCARYYIEGEYSDGGSTTGSTAGVAGGVRFRALPEIKENVKEVMFYC